jgi:ABC-type branched-subunit amino acid transport system ATPase component
MLAIEKLYSGYQDKNPILKGLDLEINKGETLAVIGQNGAGKSTLAKSILNMVPFVQGNILFEGTLITNHETTRIINLGIGIFLQGGVVFPNLTVAENIVFASSNMRRNDKEIAQGRAAAYLQYFQGTLPQKIRTKASFLSKGEQHQLALIMVLIKQPRLLILDEPSAGLSPANIRVLYDHLREIKQKEGLTLLLVEQNVQKAIEFADRVNLLQNGNIVSSFNTRDPDCFKSVERAFFGDQAI